MKGYFSYLSPEEVQEIFYLPPVANIKEIDDRHSSYVLGATLYMPANRVSAAKDVLALKDAGLMSIVLCLEDAIGDKQVEEAERILIGHFKFLADKNRCAASFKDLPFILIRVRSMPQMRRIADHLGETLKLLTEFVFPKFGIDNGREYFAALTEINSSSKIQLFGLSILETPNIMNEETRVSSLLTIKKLFDEYKSLVLNVRIGATDFLGMFGLRRSYDMTVYDIIPIPDCISSIINIFLRAGNEYVISGPV